MSKAQDNLYRPRSRALDCLHLLIQFPRCIRRLLYVFLEWIDYGFFLSFALIQKENTAKASTINVSRTPLGICFQFAIGSTFERNFFPLFFYLLFFPLPIPGTVTSVKSPFIIITSVECPFIKSWIPVLYRGKLSHGDLLSNDCYKALSLWEKLDSKGGENKTANKPSPLPPLWEFHKALVNSAPNKEGTAFLALDWDSHWVAGHLKRKGVWKISQISIFHILDSIYCVLNWSCFSIQNSYMFCLIF